MRKVLLVILLYGATAACGPASVLRADQTATATPKAIEAEPVALPLKPNSVRFAVIGDTGTGGKAEYEVGELLVQRRQKFPFDFTIMLGDNMYGAERPQDFVNKFELPFKGLLDGQVLFYATLGNHDDPNQRYYKPFNMGGKRYYTFKKASVRFFVLDSNYMEPEQLAWLDKELEASGSDWKISYFHHPIYSSGARHGAEVDLRAVVEPIFLKHGLDVVFAGHEHFYERLKPQKGIYYFTVGGSAKLREGNIVKSGQTEKGFDTDNSFMLVEIAGDEMYFQTIARGGGIVDSGVLRRYPLKHTASWTRAARPASVRARHVISSAGRAVCFGTADGVY